MRDASLYMSGGNYSIQNLDFLVVLSQRSPSPLPSGEYRFSKWERNHVFVSLESSSSPREPITTKRQSSISVRTCVCECSDWNAADASPKRAPSDTESSSNSP